MSEVVYLNGEFLAPEEAKVSVFDRGFLFADSTYEVIPFYQGVGFRLRQHMERLRQGLEAIQIELEADLESLCSELVARNGGGNQAVYLQVTRGADTRRRHAINPILKPTLFMASYPIEVGLSQSLAKVPGISAITTDDIRWRRCDIKTTALLANIIAVQTALEAGAQEALFVRDGFLTEGATSNLYLVRQDEILTPALDSHILGGTTRNLLLELTREKGISCTEQDLPVTLLAQADEVWISSSTRGVIPVVRVNGKPVADGSPGPMWHKVAKLYQAFEKQIFKGQRQ
ncbi:MAG: aminotransferase class IV [Motiliproteus sp.]|nr:aminotransferase class IV [Motiliproteus sp.]MCW9051531.1 aminotransferase class IV [Motiliproteus sp.]